MRNMDLWYARIDVEDLRRQFEAGATRAQVKRLDKNEARARSKDSLKAFGKLTRARRRRAADRERPAADRPDRRARRARTGRGGSRSAPRLDPCRTGARSPATAVACSSASATSTPRARWSVSAASEPAPGSCCCSDATTRIRSSCRQRRRSRRCSSPILGKSEFANHGQRVVEGQRLMQAASDIMLGWLTSVGLDGVKRDFYVRQLWDAKGSALVEVMEPNALEIYATHLRLDAGQGARALGRRGRDRELPRHERRLRPGARRVRRELRRPERARLRRAQASRRIGPRRGADRVVASGSSGEERHALEVVGEGDAADPGLRRPPGCVSGCGAGPLRFSCEILPSSPLR